MLSSQTRENIDQLLSKAVEEKRISAITFAATSTDEELYYGAAGLQRFTDPLSKKIDENSVFWTCSLTKLIVAVAVLQLVEQGKITYDTPVDDIMPEMANPIVLEDITKESSDYKPAVTKITLKHLLTHTSGLVYGVNPAQNLEGPSAYRSKAYGDDFSIAKFFKLIREGYPSVPLQFEPGTDFGYGWSSEIIAFIVERLSGKTIEAHCQENIFGPLGMTKTSFYLTADLKSDLVRLVCRQDGQFQKWGNRFDLIEQDVAKLKVMLGGSGLYSSTKDYLTFLRHLLLVKAGRAENPILSSETVTSMFEPALTEKAATSLAQTARIAGPNSQWGLGLCLNCEDFPGRRRKGSGFWYGWAGAYYFLDPTSGVAAVCCTQLIPTLDSEVLEVWQEAEKALYKGLAISRL